MVPSTLCIVCIGREGEGEKESELERVSEERQRLRKEVAGVRQPHVHTGDREKKITKQTTNNESGI